MPTGYSRSPKLIKGALVELSDPFMVPIPRVIDFQYNPESITRQLTPWTPPAKSDQPANSKSETVDVAGLASGHDPQESFSVALELDATDQLEKPGENPDAVMRGVRDRISALEMLVYPQAMDPVMSALTAGAAALGVTTTDEAPVVLFVWGPGMVLPVRLTSFQVEEQAYNTALFPVRAKVTIGLRVLTPGEIKRRDDNAAKRLAVAAYKYTLGLRRGEASGLVSSVGDAVIGLLPL